MSKNIHNPDSFRKAARHGQQQGFGPFRPRPKRLDAITLPNHHAPGDLQKKGLPGAADTEQAKGGTDLVGPDSILHDTKETEDLQV